MDLIKTVGGRVAFAGEHTSAKHFGSSAAVCRFVDSFGRLTRCCV